MRITTKLKTLPIEVPIVEFKLGDGTKGYALIDTGSESTIINAGFSAKNKKQIKVRKTKNNMDLVGLKETLMPKVINANCELYFAHSDDTLNALKISNALVVDLSSLSEYLQQERDLMFPIDIIIGCDTLTKTQAEIDFSTHTFIFDTL